MVLAWLFLFSLILFPPTICFGLSCYECENCVETQEFMNDHVRECTDKSYVSCIRTETKFAHHRTISRSCSQAPALNIGDCSTHLVNIMRVNVCLCSSSLCNGLREHPDQPDEFHFNGNRQSGAQSYHSSSSSNNNNKFSNGNGNNNALLMNDDRRLQFRSRAASKNSDEGLAGDFRGMISGSTSGCSSYRQRMFTSDGALLLSLSAFLLNTM